jgi:large subunit ribosomal protein L20
MSRSTNSVASRRRKSRLHKAAKGYWGDRKNHVRLTKDAVMKALAFNYEHRKQRKRNFRRLWVIRINVAAKMNGISYSKLIYGLKNVECGLNRKILSELALKDPAAFSVIADRAKLSYAK